MASRNHRISSGLLGSSVIGFDPLSHLWRRFRRLSRWQGKGKRGARARRRNGADRTTMHLDDFLAQRQPDPGPAVFVARVQALEGQEDPLCEAHVEADSQIAHLKLAPWS